MRTVGAYEAKTHLPRLLQDVAGGGEVTITKHGRPVARLVPVDPDAPDAGRTIDALSAAWTGVPEWRDTRTDAVLERLRHDRAVVPAMWELEVTNVLLVAERRGRLTEAQTIRFVSLLGDLPIAVDRTALDRSVLAAGRRHRLSAYDATYLVLAARRALPLATRDRALAAACTAAGIELLLAA